MTPTLTTDLAALSPTLKAWVKHVADVLDVDNTPAPSTRGAERADTYKDLPNPWAPAAA